jgi:hypothetical protein
MSRTEMMRMSLRRTVKAAVRSRPDPVGPKIRGSSGNVVGA